MIRDSRHPDEPTDNTLPWQAFRYIANEMSESEQTQFERLLQDDESLQQTVIDVVHQTQLIAATQTTALPCFDNRVTLVPPSQHDASPLRRRPSTGFLLAIAASLALIVFGWSRFSQPDNPPNVANAANAASAVTADTETVNSDGELLTESDKLAIAWANTLVSVTDDEVEDITLEEFSPVFTDEETENWMFAALVEQPDSSEVLQ